MAESVLRAYQIAITEPREPVYLCFDVELQGSRIPEGLSYPLSRYQAPAAPAGNSKVVVEAAELTMDTQRRFTAL
jgi:hypothetical protein